MTCRCGSPVQNWAMHRAWHWAGGGTEHWSLERYEAMLKERRWQTKQ